MLLLPLISPNIVSHFGLKKDQNKYETFNKCTTLSKTIDNVVYSPADCKVINRYEDRTGKNLTLSIDDKTTVYLYGLSSYNVVMGQTVSQFQKLGEVYNVLKLGLKINGQWVNPLNYLK